VTLVVADPSGASDTKRRVVSVRAAGHEPEFDHIVISPSDATIEVGDSMSYTADAFDTDGRSMGNVTGAAAFSTQPSGSCDGNTCTPTRAGRHTVTGTYSLSASANCARSTEAARITITGDPGAGRDTAFGVAVLLPLGHGAVDRRARSRRRRTTTTASTLSNMSHAITEPSTPRVSESSR
jgi:hypothetical protein